MSHPKAALMKYKHPVTKSHLEMNTRMVTCLSSLVTPRKDGSRVGRNISTTHLLQEYQRYVRKNIQLRFVLSACLREQESLQSIMWEMNTLGNRCLQGILGFQCKYTVTREKWKTTPWQPVFSLEDFPSEAIG